MARPEFVHLHVHSEYSLLDGAIKVKQLIEQTKAFGMPAVALTDHGTLFGGIEFYQLATAAGIKPILGSEVYLAPHSRFGREAGKDSNAYHQLLLAENEEGYRNLCHLLSAAQFEGFYYKPRIDLEILRQHSAGLIATSTCLNGIVPRTILNKGIPAAKDLVLVFAQIFPERYYLEVQENGIPEQTTVNQALLQIHHETGLPLVATNDAHYLSRADAESHDILLCIQTGKTISDADRMRMSSDEFYLKSADEMAERLSLYPQATENTLVIAERCNLKFNFSKYYFPNYQPTAGQTLEQELTRLAETGLAERLSHRGGDRARVESVYHERLTRELDILIKMGFAGYFLIVADFIAYAREKQIPVGPGRGSGAGSLVAYALKITNIDPICYGLLFERFLNPERVSMPDFDVDFCQDRRDEVIRYVTKKYSGETAAFAEQCVSQIITFGKMNAKAAIRDVGRAMNLAYGEVDRIAKLVPNQLSITLDEAIEAEPKLQDLINQDERIAKLIQTARALEGLNRHASIHAAGVVIGDRPLVDHMPLYQGRDGEVVSQYDMKSIEKIGLIKFDFLGLKTLTVIDNTLKIIKRTKGIALDIDAIPMDDLPTYELLSAGDTVGIFQLESAGMRELVVKMRPERFEDLIALVALYRPGPLGSGMVDDFIRRKHGEIKITYDLGLLEPILKETYGIIVYQEQVMQIASTMANYALGEADLLRRAMGKKKPEEMAAQKKRFIDGANQNGIAPKLAERIFDLVDKFAGYGFNKSHSAAYAYIAYQTAYLKAHHGVEFLASLLTHDMNNTDKIFVFIHDCLYRAIRVLPPDINESLRGFTVVGDAIRFGLAAIKNVGEGAIESITQIRLASGQFHSIQNFLERVDSRRVNKRVVEALIKSGCFDSMDPNRASLEANLDTLFEAAHRQKKEQESGQQSLFGEFPGSDGQAPDANLVQVEPWSERKKLGYEKEAIGFYISGHPLREHLHYLQQFQLDLTKAVRELQEGRKIRLCGIVSAIREKITKKGDRMAFVTIEDMSGMIDMVVFADLYSQTHALLQSSEPLLIIGTAEVGDESVKILANEIAPIQVLDQIAKELHLHLPIETVNEEKLERLKTVLAQHQGGCSTYVHLIIPRRSETTLLLPSTLKVAPSEQLIGELHALFGEAIVAKIV